MVNILSYLLIVILSFIFTYIFNVRETYIFFTMILLLPIIDYLLFRYARNNMEFKITCLRNNIEKNKITTCDIEIINKGLIPILHVIYEIKSDNSLLSEEEAVGVISVSSNSKEIKSICIKGNHIGLSKIVLNKIIINSLFGLFKKTYSDNLDSINLEVLPRIMNIDGIDKLLEEEINSEGEADEEIYSLNGEPGYEYREYIPGDSLNKVNWKLSAKSNKLLIRKDEGLTKCKKVIFLDSYIIKNEDSYDLSDLLIEGALGLSREVYLLDFDIDLYYKKKRVYIRNTIKNDDDIQKVQRDLTSYSFEENKDRFNNINFNYNERIDFIIITSSKDENLFAFINSIEGISNSVCIISNNRNKSLENEFYIRKDYKLERI